MKRKHIVVLIAVMLCASLAGGAAAQSSGPNVPEAAVTTKFTHQGQLKRNGVLFDGTCNMRFTLWDAATAGVQQASYTVPTPVTVSEGVFAVEVDFGAQFKGEARWIQTETQCADDASYQNLPRVALNPTPYAIGLMPGAQSMGSLSGTGGIFRATNNGEGAALVGLANSATGVTYGVLGNSFFAQRQCGVGLCDQRRDRRARRIRQSVVRGCGAAALPARASTVKARVSKACAAWPTISITAQ